MQSDCFRLKLRSLATLMMISLLAFSAGCDGCRDLWSRKDKEDELDASKKKPEKVEPFESKDLKILPTDETIALHTVKPGHWFSVQQQLKSNEVDFYGELHCLSAGRASDQPLPLRQSNFRLQTNRLVSLPKGQSKTFELTYFAPTTNAETKRIWLHSHLRPPYGGANRWSQTQIATKLRPHQTYFVVLARRPDSYGYLKTLHSIKPPNPAMFTDGVPTDYIVTLPNATRRVPLPSWPMMWTMISYIIWDDFDAGVMTADQQRALLDWLHWGGQIIVSGPGSLDSLQGSFLADYLPVKALGTRTMEPSDVQPLNDQWSVRSLRQGNLELLGLNPDAAPELLDWELLDDSQFVPGSGNLIAERRVGRGRIVTTSFALTTRSILNWASFDNFFNACLMRRPPRRYTYTDESGIGIEWIAGINRIQRNRDRTERDDATRQEAAEFVFRPDLPDDSPRRFPVESLITSKLRYFSRDAAYDRPASADDRSAHLEIAGYGYGQQSGVAGWNDFSGCSSAARDALKEAAGISVPKRDFVLMTLGLYLFILVPANWALFRALGHVEWAWFSVPVIAIVGTYFVVHLAQLDIGFARSRTEIAVLETQPHYTRAHLTRYTGLYSSLSTGYVLSFANKSALSLPFGTETTDRQQTPRDVVLHRVDKKAEASRLDQFAVRSNSTEMVHSEESYDLGGEVRLVEPVPGLFRVVNETEFPLEGVGVIRRVDDQIEVAWIGKLAPREAIQASFRAAPTDGPPFDGWAELDSTGAGEIKLRSLLSLALDESRLGEGDVRLAGWSNQGVPGLTIKPAASQRTFRTVLVANLKYGRLPTPQSDENTEKDANRESEDDRTD